MGRVVAVEAPGDLRVRNATLLILAPTATFFARLPRPATVGEGVLRLARVSAVLGGQALPVTSAPLSSPWIWVRLLLRPWASLGVNVKQHARITRLAPATGGVAHLVHARATNLMPAIRVLVVQMALSALTVNTDVMPVLTA